MESNRSPIMANKTTTTISKSRNLLSITGCRKREASVSTRPIEQTPRIRDNYCRFVNRQQENHLRCRRRRRINTTTVATRSFATVTTSISRLRYHCDNARSWKYIILLLLYCCSCARLNHRYLYYYHRYLCVEYWDSGLYHRIILFYTIENTIVFAMIILRHCDNSFLSDERIHLI